MAHRVKCPVCNSCMSPIWILPDRYYFCGFCITYYTGGKGELFLVESPYANRIDDGRVVDPITEEEDVRTDT